MKSQRLFLCIMVCNFHEIIPQISMFQFQLYIAQYVQAISYVTTPVRNQWC